ERRNPACDEVRRVAGAEEPFCAMKQTVIVLVPAHPGAGAKGIDDLRDGATGGGRDLEAAGNERGAALGRECERLLFGHAETFGDGIVLDVAACRLRRQPLAHVARVGAGLAREILGGHRSGGKGPVQPQLVADDDHAGVERGAQIADEATHESVELVRIECHGVLPRYARWRVYFSKTHMAKMRKFAYVHAPPGTTRWAG